MTLESEIGLPINIIEFNDDRRSKLAQAPIMSVARGVASSKPLRREFCNESIEIQTKLLMEVIQYDNERFQDNESNIITLERKVENLMHQKVKNNMKLVMKELLMVHTNKAEEIEK